MKAWIISLLVLLPLVVSGAQTHAIEGQIELTEGGKTVRRAQGVMVYYRPAQTVTPEVPDEPYVMATRRKQFDPDVLAIPVGAQVSFPNADPILHNAFSVSGENAFDVGLYGDGEAESVQFVRPGLVKVYCNVHQSMVGHILVLDTPFFVTAGPKGAFRLDGLPEGEGTLYVWHERTRRPLAQELVLPLEDDRTLELEVSLDRRRVPSHMNKHGKSYRRDRRGRY